LIWDQFPTKNGQPANRVLGQPEFIHQDENADGSSNYSSMCWPYGIQACGNKIIVSDSGNSRVQIWETAL
jgi:hypothetical protein